MLPKNNSFINTCISEGNPNPELIGGANYNSILRPAFYVEVFEGSIYDWEGAKNSNNGVDSSSWWNRINCSEIKINSQQGQSRTMSTSFPMPVFKTDDVLNRDYETGIYFGLIESLLDQNLNSTDISFLVTSPNLLTVGGRIMINSEIMKILNIDLPSGTISVTRGVNATSHSIRSRIYKGNISKGYIIRGYAGYCDNDAPTFTEHVIKRFTGVVESIVPNDDGMLEVTATDFSTIFINALNYNYPDINSYRDMPYIDSSATLSEDIIPADKISFQVSNPSLIPFGSKIRIGSEIMLVLDVSSISPYKITVQRMAGVQSHHTGDKIYLGDSLIVGPEDVYNDRQLSKYVPTYDNWLVANAVRDLCIKAKFPLSLLNILFADSDKLRLGRSEKYPFMKTKPIFERIVTQATAVQSLASNYNNSGSTGYPSTIEKKVYLGIDQDMLGDSKFKMEFGKSLWDCLLAILDGYGFKTFFNEDGKLTIRAVRQYKWSPAAEISDPLMKHIVENNFWGWQAWNFGVIPLGQPKVFTTTFADDIKNIKFRFATNNQPSDPITVRLVFNNGGTWELVDSSYGNLINPTGIVPSLHIYQYYELEVYRASRDTVILPAGQYAVEFVSGSGIYSFFNGFLSLNNNDEVVSLECKSTLNAQISSVIDSGTDVRNKMTIIGKPKSAQPIVTSVADTPSVYGGQNVVSRVRDGLIVYGKGSLLIDGKIDKFITLNTQLTGLNTGVFVDAIGDIPMKTLIIYLKPQTTASLIHASSPETINIYAASDLIHPIATKILTEADMSSEGIVFKFAIPVPSVKITSINALDFSEIQGYENDPTYNFVGFKKETLVVKDNISDSATADWLALSLMELHRRNVQSISFPVIGNPYLQLGDCLSCAAPELGIYYNFRLWITAITEDAKKLGYISTLTVSALPPTQSYTLPPDPDVSMFANTQVYDYSITKKKTSTNEIIETVTNHTVNGWVLWDINATQTNFDISSSNALNEIVDFSYIKVDNELMYVSSRSAPPAWPSVTVIRGQQGTIATTHKAGSKITETSNLSNITFPDHYLTFNFALPRPQKVQITVGVLSKNQNIAYVMEEKVMDAGVYKRENGIKWDGGIDFAKVWPETVDKIYLFPNNDYNYMYNRMFHVGGSTNWENAANNFYWWAFEDDIHTNKARESVWAKTPSFFNASLIVKPLLNGYNGVASIVPTVTQVIDLQTLYPVYKVQWGAITPLQNHVSAYQPVTASLIVTKDGVPIDLNDAVYLDIYVITGGNANVNIQQVAAGSDTSRRWVSPIALISFAQWDFTDSQGQSVKAGTTASPQTYKFGILNCFDIYGRGVEVLNSSDSICLVDGSMKIVANNWRQNDAINELVAESFNIHLNQYPTLDQTNTATAIWVTDIDGNAVNRLQDTGIAFGLDLQTAGGQQGDSYPRITFTKKVATSNWSWNANSEISPVLISTTQTLYRNIALGGEFFYLRFFFKHSDFNGGLLLPYLDTSDAPPYTNKYLSVWDIWKPWVVIQYVATDNSVKKFFKKIPYQPLFWPVGNLTLGDWHSAYIYFHTNEIPDMATIIGCGIQLRPGAEEYWREGFSPDMTVSATDGFTAPLPILTYSKTTQTLTITGSHIFHRQGQLYSKIGNQTLSHAGAIGIHYFYYGPAGVLQTSMSVTSYNTNVKIGSVYFATNAPTKDPAEAFFSKATFDTIWIGIDSVEFAAGYNPDPLAIPPQPMATYTDTPGGSRISPLFNYTNE